MADRPIPNGVKAEPVRIRSDMSIAEAFEEILESCIRHFRLNERLVIDQRSVEGLHQARVAMRRLSAAFTLFRPVIADASLERIRADVRWFTRAIGEARNCDVYLQRDLPNDERQIMQGYRDEAYDAVIAALNSQRFSHLMRDLIQWAATGEWHRRRRASRPIAPFATRRIDHLWKQVSHCRDLVHMGTKRRHKLRIRAKKLRYSLEFTRALHRRGKKCRKFAKAIERLQDGLGRANDFAVARRLAIIPANRTDRGERGEIRAHVRAGEQALRRLHKIGRYWKS